MLTVASLLQAEAQPKDFAKVARVIYNRLDKDMPLQLDTTVLYALGRTGTRLSPEDLQTDSPYNTYKNKGLPPTPDRQSRDSRRSTRRCTRPRATGSTT